MKFTVSVVASCYNSEEAKGLMKLGFKLKEPTEGFEYYRMINSYQEVVVEFNNLKELIRFSDDWGDLVFSSNTIEIYNGYRE
tara:strand:- start:350 stop:595 length:246 start_codon:yes stop_codon:yes gene_type:complete